MFNQFKSKKDGFKHEDVLKIIESLSFDEIEWLYECCSVIIFGSNIQEIDQINMFFERKGCKLKKIKCDKFGFSKKRLRFADDKWFIRQIFLEFQNRGQIVTGRHYDSINNYKP